MPLPRSLPSPTDALSIGRSFTAAVVRDAAGSGRARPGSDGAHRAAAVAWLEAAHRATPDDGVSYGYTLRGGWRESYRETSGYIAETFFDLAEQHGHAGGHDAGVRIARWLCSVQNPDGSFSNPRYDASGIVFDTGQALIGLVRAYQATDDGAIRDAAKRAGRWLAERVDADGAFRRNTHLGHVHTYNTRVAWIMLALDAAHAMPDVKDAARRNVEWALTQERNGYFAQCAFQPGLPPFTHTIAYAIRGVWEAGQLLDDDRLRQAARRCADAVRSHLAPDGYLPGRIDVRGIARANFCCLTGNCQMAIVWLKMFQATGDAELREAADRALRYVMSCQDIDTADANVRGAIKGSHPIWGRYAPLSYPNWATKFFIDGMLLLEATTP